MTDEDIVRRVFEACGGQIYSEGIRKASPNVKTNKATWLWQLGKQSEIHAVVTAIYPLMGKRRAARMDEFLAYFEKSSGGDRSVAAQARSAKPQWRERNLAHAARRSILRRASYHDGIGP